jgi:hypothetical protein
MRVGQIDIGEVDDATDVQLSLRIDGDILAYRAGDLGGADDRRIVHRRHDQLEGGRRDAMPDVCRAVGILHR